MKIQAQVIIMQFWVLHLTIISQKTFSKNMKFNQNIKCKNWN